MNLNQIKNRLAPCGLSCEKCFAFTEGPIKNHSTELKKYLGNFDIYAQRFTIIVGEFAFAKYLEFKELLHYFANVNCPGCRKTDCQLYKGCNVKKCYKEKKVDFCFQCSEFPCNNTGFDQHLYERWVKINSKMKEIGVEDYYNETKGIPRY